MQKIRTVNFSHRTNDNKHSRNRGFGDIRGNRGLKSQGEPEVISHRGHRAIEATEPQGGKVGPCLNPSHH